MRATAVAITVVASVLLQMVVSRAEAGGAWPIDVVLVGVIYAAIYWGPAAGIIAGAAGGLSQDLLTTGVIGVVGLSKTLVGFAAGVFAAQFVVVRPNARVLVVIAGTLLHRLMVSSLHAAIDRHFVLSGTALLTEIVLNAVVGLIAFQASELLPGALSRRREAKQSSLRRRQW